MSRAERQGIDLRKNYGLIRGIVHKYFSRQAAELSIDMEDLTQQVCLAIHTRNSGRCPYKPKPGFGPSPYIYRVSWQTLGRMARKRKRWYTVQLHNDHGTLCQIAAAQGYSETGDHPLGILADKAKQERRLMAQKRKQKAKPQNSDPRFDLLDGWALLQLAKAVGTQSQVHGERYHLKPGQSLQAVEAKLYEAVNSYQRGNWLHEDDGQFNLAHVMGYAMRIIAMRSKMEKAK